MMVSSAEEERESQQRRDTTKSARTIQAQFQNNKQLSNKKHGQTPRARFSSNANTPATPRRAGLSCYGCQSTAHLLKDCPVTSPQQKKKLYDEMKKLYRSNQGYDKAQSARSANQASTQQSLNEYNFDEDTQEAPISANHAVQATCNATQKDNSIL
jgi:hypothetical protein